MSRGRKPMVLPVTAEELREVYEVQGLTCKVIAAQLGCCTKSTVKNKLIAAGVTMRKRGSVKGRVPANKNPISSDCLKVMYLEENKTLAEIGEAVGLSHEGVRQRLLLIGVELRERGCPRFEFDVEELRRLYVDEGLTAETIGKQLGFEATTVWRWLKENGIPTRPQGSWVQRKTHCVQGHAFSPENTYMETNRGYQVQKCRICHSAQMKAYHAKKRAKVGQSQ